MLITVVWLGGEVDAAIAVWTLAYFLTALFALAVARDLWLPLALPNVLDRRGRAIAGLALVMGAVQIVNLIGYRVELFVLDHYKVWPRSASTRLPCRRPRRCGSSRLPSRPPSRALRSTSAQIARRG